MPARCTGPGRGSITREVVEPPRRRGENPGVSTSSLQPHGADAPPFARLLKTWRHKRRLSQLELALESGVSQRHVSFLESGRAKPSRSMILQLSETLEVPLRERNDWLLAAGFAPTFRARPLDDPQMGQVMAAVRMMLANHEPFPALAIDRAWNVRLANRAFERLVSLIGADVWTRVGGRERNLMRLVFHRDGIRPWIANWSAIAPLLWHRARREAESLGGQEMKGVLDDLARHQDAEMLAATPESALVPVLPLELEKDGVRISVFTVIATFGTAQDVTADELRIETFFPADEVTEKLFRAASAP
jgi:transcriptional regulator with XRE-family HTH domain